MLKRNQFHWRVKCWCLYSTTPSELKLSLKISKQYFKCIFVWCIIKNMDIKKIKTRKLKALKIKLTERQIIDAFFDIIDKTKPKISKYVRRIPTEAIYNKGHLKKGVRKGTPDIFVMLPKMKGTEIIKCGLWIELKAGNNKLTPEQKIFKEISEHMLYSFVICYSPEEAVLAIEKYLFL